MYQTPLGSQGDLCAETMVFVGQLEVLWAQGHVQRHTAVQQVEGQSPLAGRGSREWQRLWSAYCRGQELYQESKPMC